MKLVFKVLPSSKVVKENSAVHVTAMKAVWPERAGARRIKTLLRLFPIAVAAALAFAGPSMSSDLERFDTRAFLTACTDLVPDVPFAVPMDAMCISQGRKMCGLAVMNEEPGRCLDEVTAWMQSEVAAKWGGLPAHMRKDWASPPTAEEMAGNDMLSTLNLSLPNCETLDVDGISKQSLCDYSNALTGWHALRVLQRAAKADAQ